MLQKRFAKIWNLVPALLVGMVIHATAFAQDDAMNDFMSETGDAATDVPAEGAADAATPATDAEMLDAAPAEAAKSAPTPAPSPKAAVADSIPSTPNPALDRIEAMMIGDSEFKVFMKAGGLRSKKIK